MKKSILFMATLVMGIAILSFTNREKSSTPEVGLNIGNKAPELSFNSPSGEVIKLSAVNKDKYVLIDFWASWCRPCRMENPAVVNAYNQFKDAKLKGAKKGFTVFGVSLDNNKEKWVEAISKDGLLWTSHVSDLGGWQSQGAKLYGVNSIPANFLIDPNGIIIAKNLRGSTLLDELNKYKESK